MYKTEKHLPTWIKNVLNFAEEAKAIGLDFEINSIANEPSETELAHLQKLTEKPWFNLHSVPREPIYASWNRGAEVAKAEVITAWNVDDIRNAKAIKDGLELIEKNSEQKERGMVVYFPFIYKRYINIFDHDFLVKRITVNPPAFEKQEFIQSMHSGPFFLYTKKAHQLIGGFDEKFTIVGDYEWQARAASNNVCFLKSEVVSGIFTNNGKTLSGSKATKHAIELQQVYEKYSVPKKA
jgi:hypothetical protein